MRPMNSLCRSRVLVVEDDMFTAAALCQALQERGATIVGPARDVASALALIASTDEIDAATLDVDLGGERVYPVADALVRRDVPFILATGCAIFDMPAEFWHILRQEKPYCPQALAGRVTALCEMSSGVALPRLVAAEARSRPAGAPGSHHGRAAPDR